MKKINVYEVGNVVRLSPAWVAWNAAKSRNYNPQAHANIARLTRGVITDVVMRGDLVPRYGVAWKGLVKPNQATWFEHEELCPINAKIDWDNIQWEKYADDVHSLRSREKMQFAREMGIEIKQAIERKIIETATYAK